MIRGLRFVAVFAILVSLSACSGSHEPKSARALAKSFEAEFGFAPPGDVSEISSKTTRIGDTWTKWMRFKANAGTFSRITRAGFEPLAHTAGDPGPRLSSSTNPNAPSWWRDKKSTPGNGGFSKSKFRSDFAASYHVVWRDTESGFVYSESGAWD